REGSTQLTAFEEVGDKLNRTAAACGFRWNAEVRRRYEKAIEIAKRQRKEKKRAMANQQRYSPRPTYSPPLENNQYSVSTSASIGETAQLQQPINSLDDVI